MPRVAATAEAISGAVVAATGALVALAPAFISRPQPGWSFVPYGLLDFATGGLVLLHLWRPGPVMRALRVTGTIRWEGANHAGFAHPPGARMQFYPLGLLFTAYALLFPLVALVPLALSAGQPPGLLVALPLSAAHVVVAVRLWKIAAHVSDEPSA